MDDASRHYSAAYLTRERWLSYVYQVTAVADIEPESLLEVGVGPGVVGNMVSATFPRCRHVSIDVDPTLSPHVCASVLAMPFADNSFDVVFCCQVLEHLPYRDFASAILELKRVTGRRIVMSLPDVTPFFFVRARYSRLILPALWRGISFPTLLPNALDFAEHGQHHWEIGRRNYPAKRILSDLKAAGFNLVGHFRMVEKSYWHFFLLDIPGGGNIR